MESPDLQLRFERVSKALTALAEKHGVDPADEAARAEQDRLLAELDRIEYEAANAATGGLYERPGRPGESEP